MDTVQDKTYEAIYYSLWEAARRYSGFTQFRVIGKSHDDRMIPMLEIGTLCWRSDMEMPVFSVWPAFPERMDR